MYAEPERVFHVAIEKGSDYRPIPVDRYAVPKVIVCRPVARRELLFLRPGAIYKLEGVRRTLVIIPPSADNQAIPADRYRTPKRIICRSVVRRELLFLDPCAPVPFEDIRRTRFRTPVVIARSSDYGVIPADRYAGPKLIRRRALSLARFSETARRLCSGFGDVEDPIIAGALGWNLTLVSPHAVPVRNAALD